jgi:hypothetical protein
MTGVALAAVVGLVLMASAGAASRAETRVSIRGGGDVFGYVRSERPGRCANERLVKVFQKIGAVGGGDDIKIGSDSASPNGDRYQWSIGNPGATGRIYARAPRTDRCKADNSKVIPAGDTKG